MVNAEASGLSSQQAQQRLRQWGPNRLPEPERRGWPRLVREVLTEPMFVLLLVAAVLYLLIGDPAEGLLLTGFALLTVGLVVVQGHRREHALQALRDLAAPIVQVRRDGRWVQGAASDLVPGDLILLREGDRVAADAQLLTSVGLSTDESLLTGESMPVRKSTESPDGRRVWAGTMVVSGHGQAEVTHTADRTRMGAIGAALSSIDLTPTPLQLQLRQLVRRLGVLALGVCGLLILLFGLSGGRWLEGTLSALALGMGMLPEEFPMVLAVFMSVGAWRLSRLQVLARRPAVIEALGAVTMLCVDKTGTLTENRLRLWALQSDSLGWGVQEGQTAPAPLQRLAWAALHASRADGFDPLDHAVWQALSATPAPTGGAPWQLVQEWPVHDRRPIALMAWRDESQALHLCAKGSPEALARRCGLSPAEIQALDSVTADLAQQGFRVLAAAQGVWSDRAVDSPLQWLGLLAFVDPLRPTVAQAVAQARQAGVQVAMITGDHLETARSLARHAGLDTVHGALSGAAFEAMDDTRRQQAAQQVRVFARVTPTQKLLLVRAFQAQGEVVAMTGDGVNDGPALKAAQVGIAMGRRGTDVAREASGLVLLDEDFGRIVQGIRMGRRIFDNLQRVSVYIVAIHVPLALLALLPLLWGWPPILLPAHVVLIEMVVDPACSLAFESAPQARDLMQRPPRPVGQGLLGRGPVIYAVLMGLALVAATLGVVAWSRVEGLDAPQGRALALVALTAGNLSMVVQLSLQGSGWTAGRADTSSWRERGPVVGVVAVSLAALATGLWWPRAAELLQVAAPSGLALAGAAAAGMVAVVIPGQGLRWSRRLQRPVASRERQSTRSAV